jgi:signal peptidase II
MIRYIYFAVLLALDQITKVIAYTQLEEGVPVPVVPGFFNFTLVYNPGAAFGLFSGLPDTYRRITLLVVSVVALIVVVRFMLKDAKDDVIAQYALIAILSGAIGNIIDRVRFDRVVDFLDVYWGSYHWPAFNIADSAISVGVTVLIIRILFAPQAQEEKSPSKDSAELGKATP